MKSIRVKRRFTPAAVRGFSLVEVMITLAIVTLGSTATISMLTFSRLHNALEMERSRAWQIISQEIEINRSSLYPRIRAGTSTIVWDNGTPGDTTDDTNGNITVRVRNAYTGEEYSFQPNPAVLVSVEVTLEWTPRGRIGNKTDAGGNIVPRIYRETAMTYIAPK